MSEQKEDLSPDNPGHFCVMVRRAKSRQADRCSALMPLASSVLGADSCAALQGPELDCSLNSEACQALISPIASCMICIQVACCSVQPH